MGPRAGMDRYRKSRPRRDSIPGPSYGVVVVVVVIIKQYHTNVNVWWEKLDRPATSRNCKMNALHPQSIK